MGEFLDMVNNDKPNPVKKLVPNENYARELMQLFTIGLTALNPDGTRKVDTRGQPVSAYTEEDIKQATLCLTGWTYPPQPGFLSKWKNPPYYYGDMVAFEDRHDTTSKFMWGHTFPGGRSAQADLNDVLQLIFMHPNVGPFVGYRLIQRLVTSNPTPAYVGRVAAAFNGPVRGDLKAVTRAILLDPEAGTSIGSLPAGQGHLREPVLFATALLRALGATSTDEPSVAGYTEPMGQKLFFPNSVFNYFSPFYRIPGANVPAPEFQILNPTTSLARINFVNKVVTNSLGSSVRIPIEHFEALAGDVNMLADAVSKSLLRGEMQPDMRASILKALAATGDKRLRARSAIYLAASSSRFQVRR
jgi:uncharacterized protein (DUF1800 family)